jgi:hypothetical protein
MEKMFAAVGATTVIALVLFLVAPAAMLFAGMWFGWWLHPLWAPLLGPLGVPAIGFWQFVGLKWFLGAMSVSPRPTIKAEYREKYDSWSTFVVVLVWPVIAYYAVRWALQ